MLDERLLPYYGLRSELDVYDDLIFKGHQLVIPSSENERNYLLANPQPINSKSR